MIIREVTILTGKFPNAKRPIPDMNFEAQSDRDYLIRIGNRKDGDCLIRSQSSLIMFDEAHFCSVIVVGR